MQKNIMPAIIIAALVISSCNNKTEEKEMAKTEYNWPDSIAAPVAEKKAKELSAHGDTRIDNYYWMNDYFKKGPDSSKV
ncbi:MAG: hypothetical protein WAR80_01510, partial [Ferruginibacter sp.]